MVHEFHALKIGLLSYVYLRKKALNVNSMNGLSISPTANRQDGLPLKKSKPGIAKFCANSGQDILDFLFFIFWPYEEYISFVNNDVILEVFDYQ